MEADFVFEPCRLLKTLPFSSVGSRSRTVCLSPSLESNHFWQTNQYSSMFGSLALIWLNRCEPPDLKPRYHQCWIQWKSFTTLRWSTFLSFVEFFAQMPLNQYLAKRERMSKQQSETLTFSKYQPEPNFSELCPIVIFWICPMSGASILKTSFCNEINYDK